MKGAASYDGDLRMFRESAQPINMERLRFLRWLVEQGKLEHLPAGPPAGPLADEQPEGELLPAA
jgi:hypothetical protein